MTEPGGFTVAVEFDTHLAIPPLPSDSRRAARTALRLSGKVAAEGGFDAAIEAAVDAIYAAGPGDPPTELHRLRMIYRDFHTRDELRDLARASLRQFGIVKAGG